MYQLLQLVLEVLTQQAGETAEGLKARQDAANNLTTRQQSLAGLAPQVAQEDALQTTSTNFSTTRCWFFSTFLQRAQQEASLLLLRNRNIRWTIRS